MTGGVSAPETVNVVFTAWLPCASAAEHVTVVTPSGNVEPDARVQVATPRPSTASCVAGAV